MPPDLLKPLAAFCTQSKSRRFIKTVRNLGDAGRNLSEQPSFEHTDAVVIETKFGLNFKLRKDFNSRHDFSVKLDIAAFEPASQDVQSTHTTTTSGPRHFRIFADYGTDFIWLNDNDLKYNDQGSYIELEDALDRLPNEVVDNYDAWVEIYTTNFKERCDDPGDYSVDVFPTVMEEVAWNVAGLLLAWRVALAPHVGSVEFGVGREKHVLRKGENVENVVIYSFLEDQAVFLSEGETFQ